MALDEVFTEVVTHEGERFLRQRLRGGHEIGQIDEAKITVVFFLRDGLAVYFHDGFSAKGVTNVIVEEDESHK